MKLSVIVPVYNEQETVVRIIREVQTCGVPSLEIIVVNDCSTDGTRDVLLSLPKQQDLLVLHHDVNQGKGAAIRTGRAHVSGDAVVIQDADLEYSPMEFPAMLELLSSGKADVVYGSRYSGTTVLVDSFWHHFGNKALTTYSNVLSNMHLTDMETCYKMVKATIFKGLDLKCNRFGIEPEITAKLAKQKCRIYEMPISYEPRRFDQGKKIGWKDGFAAVWYITKFNLFCR
jgi:glycosyltransferase involved in cell wall biosynthesis